jgi:Putative transposase of IS4/5 family (DUF4096)
MSSTRCSTWRRTAAKWRALPEQFGNWHTIYTRLRRWAAAGVLDRAFQALQEHRLIRIRVEWVGLDSTSVKVHPEGTGARKKTARKPPEVARRPDHQDPSGCRECAHGPALRPVARTGPRRPEGRKSLTGWHRRPEQVPMVIDRAYAGDATRQRVLQLGFEPVVPPNPNRLRPWTSDRSR